MSVERLPTRRSIPVGLPSDVLVDGHNDDVQLALYLCNEVQHTGLPWTEHLEWDLEPIMAVVASPAPEPVQPPIIPRPEPFIPDPEPQPAQPDPHEPVFPDPQVA